jgi:hypothetical protein
VGERAAVVNPYVESAAVVCGAVTMIVGASLAFVARLARWEREDQARDEKDAKTRREAPRIYPFLAEVGYVGTLCPVCNLPSANDPPGGLEAPRACADPPRCSAKEEPHLHVRCRSCRSDILMEPFFRGPEGGPRRGPGSGA